METAEKLFGDFVKTLHVEWNIPRETLRVAEAAIAGCAGWQMRTSMEREHLLVGLVNSKLKLNRDRFQCLLDAAAKRRISLNYHDKAILLECLDFADDERFRKWLETGDIDPTLESFFEPCTRDETLAALHQQLRTGFVLRKDAKKSSVGERKNEVLQALFSSYVFHSFPVEAMHRHFNTDCRREYISDFYQHLLRFHPKVLHRDCALIFLRIDEKLRAGQSLEDFRDQLFGFIRESYERLSNHCFLALLITPLSDSEESAQWKLFSDLILYAEKHREIALKGGYFRPQEIEAKTLGHIPNLNATEAHFELANEGFFFKDCFVLTNKEIRVNGSTQKHWEPVEILLIFDKNERDESLIPCPACRSLNVRGNSYSTIGVRSWECNNPICPEKSAFNRGNRYSLASLIKQEAIKATENLIPKESLKMWKLDVVSGVRNGDVSDMLLRHFTLFGDTAIFVNAQEITGDGHGRTIKHEQFVTSHSRSGEYLNFHESSFFRRFVIERKVNVTEPKIPITSSIPDADVYQGDCVEILAKMELNSFDGAVTSPPYFNARSYSIWPNVYCYLYDMYNAGKEVYRVLRPGSIYLFNIFDYFDNENTIAFSAMGNKRMILGAYILDLFRRVGFQVIDNIGWHKGEIEGKRNFNQGNRSPYYQYPLNCWEHVFVFRKPGGQALQSRFPKLLQSKPVIKMVNGENILGHSAPFPPAIPELLLNTFKKGQIVLDPYSGSMTTGRAAHRLGFRSVSIELHSEYCELGMQLLQEETVSASIDMFAVTGENESRAAFWV